MIKVFKTLAILILSMSAINVVAQIQEEKLENYADSTYRFQGIIPPVEFQYNLYEIYDSQIINQFEEDVLYNDNPSTLWLRTELIVSNQTEIYDLSDINTHFTSHLYQQYLKDSEFDMLRYILGTAQVSAVAYMAYRHIKKYGFWK